MIQSTQSDWVSVRRGDASWQLQGDLTIANRAGIEIDSSCPDSFKQVILMAISRGWVQPVAYVPTNDPTLMWDRLKKKED